LQVVRTISASNLAPFVKCVGPALICPALIVNKNEIVCDTWSAPIFRIPYRVNKRLELLREVVPGLRRLTIMSDMRNPEAAEAQSAARALGLEVGTSDIRRAEDIAPAFVCSKARQTRFMSAPIRSSTPTGSE
jgi:hypothetical protein